MTNPIKKSSLEFLSGIRGFAAFYVLGFHLYQEAKLGAQDNGHPLSGNFDLLFGWVSRGQDAVAVLIVLSGFLLMMPAARKGPEEAPAGKWTFLRNRALRILPPYYATLLWPSRASGPFRSPSQYCTFITCRAMRQVSSRSEIWPLIFC
jgi:peptidoglycan/LPS O-acetylase OafA/YrhL